MRWLFASVHLLALGIGLGAICVRAAALRHATDPGQLERAFRADNLWGLAAILWIATGLVRAFGGLEKGTAYYLATPAFHVKIGLLLLIIGLEIWPATNLIRWRSRVRHGEPMNLSRATTFSRISVFQAMLVVLMVFAASAMARGI
jgi:putative membrane protein